MNGIPVYPKPKNGERPYLAVPEATFWGLFFGLFLLFLYPTFVSRPLTPHPIPLTHPRKYCNYPNQTYLFSFWM